MAPWGRVTNDRLCAQLVCRIHQRESEADRDSFDAILDELARARPTKASSSSGTRISPVWEMRSRTSLRRAPGMRKTGASANGSSS